ncbi:MAG TPA: TIGR00730 family Rossman fold protein, partial [Bacteroidales bacterium]|nr:TIGR00730 family Rossman fold protein [Bacteroidales bacterium]
RKIQMSTSEEKIRNAFQEKTWNEIKSEDSWRIFKIMAEFVEGYEKLSRIGPCVSIFGSARLTSDSEYYKLAEQVAFKLTQFGYGIITGGGPGIMEAANLGAKRGLGRSVGINIALPYEQNANLFIDHDKLITFDYFFVRKTMFMKYAQGFIVLPGGFGTFDELFEALTLIQTEKIGRFPIVLIGKEYWGGLVDWIKKTMLEDNKCIHPDDMNLFHLVDDPDEAVEIINSFYSKYLLSPNF